MMLQEGFTVLVIGMTTVLAFLVFLVVLIHMMGRFVAWFIPPSQPTTVFSVSSDEESLVVAIAAARRARG
ncbi:MAG: OadG family protein [Luteolibacter sp.]